MRRLLNHLGRYSVKELTAMPSTETQNSPSESHRLLGDVAYLSLSSRLKAGWYMLEIAVDLPCAKSITKIHLDFVNASTESMVYSLPIRSSRTAKRLIHVPALAHLHLEPLSTDGAFVLRTFRLTRVGQYFAHARIKTKLLNRHPL